MSEQEVVALHTASAMPVLLIGFMPGFPYIGGLPSRLHLPRRSEPRTSVAAGSVAIANDQTGIYPHRSPGGWHIIGRTSARLFDPRREPPALLHVGDHVRFVAG
jgi:KipI family sensor histidine kinase inhibitor